jgi:heavy metal sensor kinase
MRRLLTTRGRLVLISVGILTAALLVADSGLLTWLAVNQTSQSDSVLQAQASAIASSIDESGGQLTFDSSMPGETSSGIAVDAAIVGGSGPVAQTPGQPLSTRQLLDLARRARAAHGRPVWASLTSSKGLPWRAYATTVAGSSNPTPVLVATRSVAEMQSTMRRTALLLTLLSLGLIVLEGLVAYWLAGRALKPVRRIAGLAKSISERDLHRRVEVKVPPDELGELVDTFNGMLGRLEASFESLRRFTADASHELRAPLALIRAELEGSLSKQRTQAEHRQTEEMVLDEVEHLGRLSDQLLLLARADAGALVPSPETIDVVDFMHETAARWESAADQKGVRVLVNAPADGAVKADPALLRRLLDNLMDNAVRHTASQSSVVLRACRAEGGWHLEVADQGPGIPPDYRERLFTRFSRPDGARERNGGGAGLGLALSEVIATVHGGKLSLLPENGPGATFRLFLPDPAPSLRRLQPQIF